MKLIYNLNNGQSTELSSETGGNGSLTFRKRKQKFLSFAQKNVMIWKIVPKYIRKVLNPFYFDVFIIIIFLIFKAKIFSRPWLSVWNDFHACLSYGATFYCKENSASDPVIAFIGLSWNFAYIIAHVKQSMPRLWAKSIGQSDKYKLQSGYRFRIRLNQDMFPINVIYEFESFGNIQNYDWIT